MKLSKSGRSGFTLVEIMIVVALIGLLASIAVPNYVKARGNSQQSACVNNLRQIDGAAQTWALETKQPANGTYTLADLIPYIKLDASGNIPGCPAKGIYQPGATVANENSRRQYPGLGAVESHGSPRRCFLEWGPCSWFTLILTTNRSGPAA